MPTELSSGSENPMAKAPSPTTRVALSLVLGVVLGSLGMAVIFRNPDSGLWSHIWSAVLGRSTRIDVSQPTVVSRVQQLQRLETVVYTMDKVVTGQRENAILPDFLAGDRLLLLVHGEVVAGIDFGNLQSGDVKVSGKQIRLRLPEPQLFSTRLDNAATRVYSRQTGLLVPTDPNLETQARQEGERQLQESALRDGILKTAQKNARATLTSLLQGLGFEKIGFD